MTTAVSEAPQIRHNTRVDRKQSIPRVKVINQAILAEEERLRASWPLLAHQDAIGMLVFLGSAALIGVFAALYLTGALPWWLAIPLITLPLSLLHELEHDLIHDLYYRHRPGVQDAMFAGIFLAKMTMDPWTRRRIHLRHHRLSGQPADIEERLIGLGLPMGLKRLLITTLPVLTAVLLPGVIADLHHVHESAPAERPVPLWHRLVRGISTLFALLPLVVLPAALLGSPLAAALAVLYVGPNLLRHASIAFISSSSHYYGDIPDSAVYYQNQILDHWLTWPLQLFCFNFGATHILHHYVVRQPFYLRQLIAPRVREVLLAEGVRRNDLGTFRRANRYRSA